MAYAQITDTATIAFAKQYMGVDSKFGFDFTGSEIEQAVSWFKDKHSSFYAERKHDMDTLTALWTFGMYARLGAPTPGCDTEPYLLQPRDLKKFKRIKVALYSPEKS